MWIYCKNDIEIECSSLENWEANPDFLVIKDCTIRKKITSKKGIAEIILNSSQVEVISETKLDWHELQRIR